LVQPLRPGAVADYLTVHGEGLHHVCFVVDEVVSALQALPGSERTDRVYVGGRGCLVSFIAARPSNVNIEFTESIPSTHLVRGGQ
jgi:methylmalonyl-CoA/ethylmalonyl-CoA epimerase